MDLSEIARESGAQRNSHLEGLNAAQRAAVTFGVADDSRIERAPPLLVVAGAGTGKTKTLAHRVAHLILNGAHPGRIMLLTFGRRMAAEMTRRVEHICAKALRGRSPVSARAIEWSGTFHSVGAKLLRAHADSIGLVPEFSILDRGDAADLIDWVRDDLGFAKAKSRFPKKATCLAIYSHAVNAQKPLRDTLERAFPWCADWEKALSHLFGAYVQTKQRQAALDFDDLLLYWARMMECTEIAKRLADNFDHILVDEYQDTNALQASILLALKPDGAGLTVVGDDAQAIYSFRSARARNILEFPGRFDPPAEVIKLEQNYRSTQPILNACNGVIGHATERFTKNLFTRRADGTRPALAMVADETQQVEFVIERVLANREAGMELREQAVLFRSSHHSTQLEIELTRRNIPFVKFGGLKFLEAAHVRDVLAILRWAENSRDHVAGFRVLKLLPGVGPAGARRTLANLHEQGHSFPALESLKPSTVNAEAWFEFAALMKDLAGETTWLAQMERLRRWYDPLLELLYDAAHVRQGDLAQLEQMATQHATRSSFLTDLALDPPEASGSEAGPPVKDEDWLVLSTIHSAKGQEWRAVFVLNVVDGCIPSDLGTGTSEEIEEERRILYVAMTRAKDDLVLMQPLRFYVRGQGLGTDRHIYAPRSRFITDADVEHFDVAGLTLCATETGQPVPLPESARVDLKQTMRAMWS